MAPVLSTAHGVDEQGVEEYERGAGQEVDEDDAKPVVDIEVGVRVDCHPRHELVSTRLNGATRVNLRRQPDRLVLDLDEAAHLGQNGGQVDGNDDANEVSDGAQLAGPYGVTDEDIALDGQRHRQPDGGCVKDRRQVVYEAVVGEAPTVRNPIAIVLQGEEVDVAGYRPDARQEVGGGNGDEDGVCRVAHVRAKENGADKTIRDECDQDEEGRSKAVDRHKEWAVPQKEGSAAVVAWNSRNSCVVVLHSRLFGYDDGIYNAKASVVTISVIENLIIISGLSSVNLRENIQLHSRQDTIKQDRTE